MRFWLAYLVLVLLSCLPASCSRGPGRNEMAMEPADTPDTALAKRQPPDGCTLDSLGRMDCPEMRPPGAR